MEKSSVLAALEKFFRKPLVSYFSLIIYTCIVICITVLTLYLSLFPQTFHRTSPVQKTLTQLQTGPSDTGLTEVNTPQPDISYSPLDQEITNESTGSASVILHGPRDKKQIALTFDAEMTDFMREQLKSGRLKSSFDKTIIDILNQTNTKATIFLTGIWIELYPDITKNLAKNQLIELGSHSYADYSFSGQCYGLQQITPSQQIEQVGATELLLKIYGGIENKIFRFPGGCYSPDSLDLIHSVNDFVVHWDVNGNDGFNNNTQQIINNVINNTQNGSIIILHVNGPPNAPKTAEALPVIIQTLKAKGFEFVKVSELLGFTPETRIN